MKSVNLLVFAAKALADCECGYSVRSSHTPTNTTPRPTPDTLLFTEVLETDFLHVYSLPNYTDSTQADIDSFGWQAQAYNVSPADARGPFGKAAQVNNVVANPLSSIWDWGGQGVNGGDPGLKVWVRSDGDLLATGEDKLIRTGELAAVRQDMVFGSLRVGMKMSDVKGTCAAFFWYRNNTSEIDLEFLSHQIDPENGTSPAPLNLVLQTPLSAARGFDASDTPYFKVIPLPFIPSDSYHEYRMDWLSESITFFVDGSPLWTITDESAIPAEPGHLMINHWSNGDRKWSGGPPVEDAVLSVSYVKAYFNSSDETRVKNFTDGCAAKTAPPCVVQEADWSVGINPMREGDNVTGKTPFVTSDPGWSNGNDGANGHKKGAAGRAEVAVSTLLSAFLALVLAGIVL